VVLRFQFAACPTEDIIAGEIDAFERTVSQTINPWSPFWRIIKRCTKYQHQYQYLHKHQHFWSFRPLQRAVVQAIQNRESTQRLRLILNLVDGVWHYCSSQSQQFDPRIVGEAVSGLAATTAAEYWKNQLSENAGRSPSEHSSSGDNRWKEYKSLDAPHWTPGSQC
jgi:hypothetical protein